MKLVINGDRIAATATDGYDEKNVIAIAAPADFDVTRMGDYRYSNGVVEIGVPAVVTMRQARLALLQSGLLNSVQDAISGGTDEEMKIEWDYATTVDREWPSLISLAEGLGIDEKQMDDLFTLAYSL
jgi:hypothetical protein